MAGGQQVIETALWGLSLLITAAVCFWVGVGVGRGEGVPRDRNLVFSYDAQTETLTVTY